MRKNFAKDMMVGTVHSTRSFGDVVITSYNSTLEINVKFLDTGYETTATSGQIRKGSIKDKFKPSVYGVGIIGDGPYLIRVNGILTDTYVAWRGMLERAYCDKLHAKHPTYKECEVCEEWQYYQTFAAWYEENYPKDGENYALDKDIKVEGNKLYSPDTCLFVTSAENAIKANAMHFKIVSPDNEVIEVYNLNDFSRKNGLSPSAVSRVVSGKRPQHKGWTRWQ